MAEHHRWTIAPDVPSHLTSSPDEGLLELHPTILAGLKSGRLALDPVQPAGLVPASRRGTVSGDVLSDPTLEAPVPKGIREKGGRHLLQRAHSSCTERASQAELVALRVSEDDPADI